MHSGNCGALRGPLKESLKGVAPPAVVCSSLVISADTLAGQPALSLWAGVRTEHNPGGGCHFGNFCLFLNTFFKFSFGLFV